ncbi:MAG: tetratricopeptide repeat protein [Alphaproteobacteria bacterium]
MANSSAQASPVDRNDPCPCGSGKKFKKCCIDKFTTNVVATPAINIGLTLQQAAAALNAGSLEIAEAALASVLRVQPNNTDALNLAAYICMQRKQLDTAMGYISKAIDLNKKNGLFYFTASLIAKAQRKFDDMENLLLKALELKPPGYISQIYSNLGDCLHEKRNIPAAIDYFSKAIAADVKNARAFFYRGMARYESVGLNEQVESDIAKGLELTPHAVDMLCKFAGIYNLNHEFDKAQELLERARIIHPDHEEVLFLYAVNCEGRGEIEKARETFSLLLQKHPQSVRGRVADAFLLPVIPHDMEEIKQWRDRFMQGLQKMIDDKIVLHEPERQGLYLPFYQGYHGLDNKEFMQKLAEFFITCCPSINYTAAHCLAPRVAGKKIRIGFVSEFFHSKLITQFFSPLITSLAKDSEYEVIIFAHSARVNDKVQTLSSDVKKYVPLPISLPAAQQIVADEEIDVLIYLDIGLRLPSYLLALARLAPVQAVMGGHPLTTGIPNMDYFLTTACMEADGAEKHYTEKLFKDIDFLAVVNKQYIPCTPISRAELGLPDGDVHLYTCPVLLFKLHPDMDIVFSGILKKDIKARIILFDAGKIIWRQELEKRFATSVGSELAERIIFVPFAATDKFIHTMRAMDAVFDALHFSFGTTAFQLLGSEVPFVTKPGEFLRGRGAYGLFKMMNMLEMTADTVDGYIDIIVKLANDKTFYKQAQENIRKNNDSIFDNYAPVPEFISHLKRIYSEVAQ